MGIYDTIYLCTEMCNLFLEECSMKNLAFERIRTAVYKAIEADKPSVILLKDETVSLLLKYTDVKFADGNLVVKYRKDTIEIGIHSNDIMGEHAYLHTFNGMWTFVVPRVDVNRSEIITVVL